MVPHIFPPPFSRGEINFPPRLVFITNGGHFVTSLGLNKYIGSLLEGDKSGLTTLVNSFPRPLHFRFLFYLENIYSKKVVFLIASGGKKWSLRYNHTGNGGKMWGQ
jgi:hypothetical protein